LINISGRAADISVVAAAKSQSSKNFNKKKKKLFSFFKIEPKVALVFSWIAWCWIFALISLLL
jgi:hypothetical protein